MLAYQPLLHQCISPPVPWKCKAIDPSMRSGGGYGFGHTNRVLMSRLMRPFSRQSIWPGSRHNLELSSSVPWRSGRMDISNSHPFATGGVSSEDSTCNQQERTLIQFTSMTTDMTGVTPSKKQTKLSSVESGSGTNPWSGGKIGKRTPYSLAYFYKSKFVAYMDEMNRRYREGALDVYGVERVHGKGLWKGEGKVEAKTPQLAHIYKTLALEKDKDDGMGNCLFDAGNAHEERILVLLKRMGFDVVTIPRQDFSTKTEGSSSYEQTIEALKQGREIIHQAILTDDEFNGYSDFLLRADIHWKLVFEDMSVWIKDKADFQERKAEWFGPKSEESKYNYAVCEVKLSTMERPEYAIQASCYADMLSKMIGMPPHNYMYLWLGGTGAPIQLRCDDVLHFYRKLRSDFEKFARHGFDAIVQSMGASESTSSSMVLPDAPMTKLAPWTDAADQVLKESDDVYMVCGITIHQARRLKAVGISTVAELAAAQYPGTKKLRMASKTFDSLQRQARLQHSTKMKREQDELLPADFEVLGAGESIKERNGLTMIPPEHPLDMFFDMESDPLPSDSGPKLEYLFGISTLDGFDSGSGSGSDFGFRFWWAHNRDEERKAFCDVVQFINDRFADSENCAHVYHYGNYEQSSMSRLANQYKNSDDEQARKASELLERLLIKECAFVDIYKVVQRGIRLGEPSYSIKKVEKLCGVKRGSEVQDAVSSVAMYHQYKNKVMLNNATQVFTTDQTDPESPEKLLADIKEYNQQDCDSLVLVTRWLRALQIQSGLPYVDPKYIPPEEEEQGEKSSGTEDESGGSASPRKSGTKNGSKSREQDMEASTWSNWLHGEKFKDALASTEAKPGRLQFHVSKVLADVLTFHFQEQRPELRRYADRLRAKTEDLIHDPEVICALKKKACPPLQPVNESPTKKAQRIYICFDFDPEQQCGKLNPGAGVAAVSYEQKPVFFADIDEIDHIQGFVRISLTHNKLTKSAIKYSNEMGRHHGAQELLDVEIMSLISTSGLHIKTGNIKSALINMVRSELKHAIEVSGVSCWNENKQEMQEKFGENHGYVATLKDAKPVWTSTYRYLRREPAVYKLIPNPSLLGSDVANLLPRVLALDQSVLAVQGPPGTGKTETSAKVIEALAKQGLRVAISSNSHASIDNLLMRVAPSLPNQVGKFGQYHEVLKKAGVIDLNPKSGKKSERESQESHMLVFGATCYQLCLESRRGAFDYLFVDEASQVSLANFLSMSSCATNAVLVGDQQQLEMPLQGDHDELTGQSCLSYLVGAGNLTVPPEYGVFLPTTFRLAPKICKFISDSLYNHELQPDPCTSNNFVQLKNRRFFDRLKSGLPKQDSQDPVEWAKQQLESLSIHKANEKAEQGTSGIIFLGYDGDSDIFGDDGNSLEEESTTEQWSSIEVDLVLQVYGELLGSEYCSSRAMRSGATDGVNKITTNDIVIVAPYNWQVSKISRAMSKRYPHARVGTVDKFQGQQAPIVIVSMCGSVTQTSINPLSAEDENDMIGSVSSAVAQNGSIQVFNAPGTISSLSSLSSNDVAASSATGRGVKFVLNRNRMNVAVSRAECLAVVIGSHGLARAKVNSLDDLILMNLYCKLIESSEF